jgi:two-component system, NarL family, sensor histidine kinase UhpB
VTPPARTPAGVDRRPAEQGARPAPPEGPEAPFTPTKPPRSRVVRRLLRVPLFYKIVFANAAIVLLATIVGAFSARAFVRAGADLSVSWVILLGLAGVLLTVLVNAIIVRVALTPLKLLEQTAARVQSGDLDARVPFSPLRDPELERVTGTFNAMLDTLETYRQRLREVAARALNAEEEERKRIARELHDDTAQSLAALLIRLRLLRGTDDPAERERTVDEFRAEVGQALERVRRFARGLRPPALDELGLVPGLESHIRGLSESVGVPIRMEAEHIENQLTPQAELALYRIAQEAISNAIRHASPGEVRVEITRTGDQVTLAVRDDGSGFLVDAVMGEGERGLGLFGMQERAAYVGGHVTVQSRPGGGTLVQAVIPTSSQLRPYSRGEGA